MSPFARQESSSGRRKGIERLEPSCVSRQMTAGCTIRHDDAVAETVLAQAVQVAVRRLARHRRGNALGDHLGRSPERD